MERLVGGGWLWCVLCECFPICVGMVVGPLVWHVGGGKVGGGLAGLAAVKLRFGKGPPLIESLVLGRFGVLGFPCRMLLAGGCWLRFVKGA